MGHREDLILTPMNRNGLSDYEWKKARKTAGKEAARRCLPKRIAKYKPEAIVPLLLKIEKFVHDAAKVQCNSPTHDAVCSPYGSERNRLKFLSEMERKIPNLPKN